MSGKEKAKKYISEIMRINEYETEKGGGEYPLHICPECEEEAMVNIGNGFKCFACGENYNDDEIVKCNDCGQYYRKNDEDFEICPKCLEIRRNE